MGKIAIVADSTASVPPELKKQYGIRTVPLLVHIDGTAYRDVLDITDPAELFPLVDKSGQFPTTAAPALGEFVEVYRDLSRNAEGILTLTMSSVLSATYGSAMQVKEQLAQELSPVQIEVFDSMSTVGGLGLMVLAAARAADAGGDMVAVVAAAEEVKSRITHLYVFDTLTYLARSGRISKAAAMAGNMLNMKPITEMPPSLGRPVVAARPRTRKKAVRLLLDMVAERMTGEAPLHVMVEHVCAPKEAAELKEMVMERFHCADALVCQYSPVSALIVGPGVVGLSCYQE